MSNQRLKDFLYLSFILLLGLSFRLWGIHWGFPRIDLNPDELNVLNISSQLTLKDLNPHYYSYSGLTFYLNYFSTHLLSLFHFNMDPVHRLLVQRLWNVFWGTLTILLCFWSAKELFNNKRAGFIAAAFMSILPLHVWDSHLGTTDIGFTFWTVFAFLMSIKAYKKPSMKYFFLGGLVVGFAIGVKYNGALAGISFLTAALLALLEHRISWQKVILFGGLAFSGAVIAFFISSPYLFLDYHHTIAGFLTEYKHTTGSGHFGFDLSAAGWQYHPYVYQLFVAFPFSLGFLLWMASFAGIIFFIYKSHFNKILLGLSFAALYFFIFASWKLVPLRYYLPLIPVLIIISSFLFDQLLTRTTKWGFVVLVLVFAYTFVFSATTTHRFKHDTRLEAASWVVHNLKPGSQIFLVDPHFGFSYSPFFNSNIFRPSEISLRDLERGLNNHSFSSDSIFCLSSLDYDRYYRLKKDQIGIRIWDSIRNHPETFQKIITFESWFLNKWLYIQLDPMFEGYFISPTIEFYQLVPDKGPQRASLS